MKYRLAILIAALAMPLLAIVVLAESSRNRAPESVPNASKPYGIEPANFASLSSSTCASASCHGGGAVGRKGSEQTTWAPEANVDSPADPHSKSYRVLFNAESVRIAKALKIPEAHKHPGCLGCHAIAEVQPSDAISEGVGCSGCHGPAEKWLSAHTRPEWKTISNRDRSELYGFAPTKNLVARTLACVRCHVGDAAREVNHDLIAAGHPRLAFESARFHFSPGYRKHWQEKTPMPDFEVRVWLVGQIATLRAATDLLRIRAERADHKTESSSPPWPEFAGQSCFSCHQRIGRETTTRNPKEPNSSLGLPVWEVWSNAAFDVSVNLCGEVFPSVESSGFDSLISLRSEMGKRKPDPKRISELAGLAVSELDSQLAKIQAVEDCGTVLAVRPETIRKFVHSLSEDALSKDRKAFADKDWDSLAIRYLGCAAMYHAVGGRKAEPEWSEPIAGLAKRFAFPSGFNSPAEFGTKERDEVRALFARLYDATKEPGEKR